MEQAKVGTLYVGGGLFVGVLREGKKIVWADTVRCGSEKRALQRARMQTTRREGGLSA